MLNVTAVEQLGVISVEMTSHSVTLSQVGDIFSVCRKLYRAEDGALGHAFVNSPDKIIPFCCDIISFNIIIIFYCPISTVFIYYFIISQLTRLHVGGHYVPYVASWVCSLDVARLVLFVFIFLYFFVFLPCASLSCPSRQLLSAR